ncbi:response regulator [Propylenella binzhouense]|uniref:response regulator n=1 Tax=Propylenella binzhouense TaxID=2555902 RepID=UPI0031B640BB
MDPAHQILVVEDEFLIAMELDLTLRRAGYAVLGPAASVRVALDLLQRGYPDAAILDVDLAGERVTPVAEVLRRMSIPFILASGYGSADLAADGVLRDAINVGKPFGAGRLLRELNGLLSPTG